MDLQMTSEVGSEAILSSMASTYCMSPQFQGIFISEELTLSPRDNKHDLLAFIDTAKKQKFWLFKSVLLCLLCLPGGTTG